jgi:hypothetical protein
MQNNNPQSLANPFGGVKEFADKLKSQLEISKGAELMQYEERVMALENSSKRKLEEYKLMYGFVEANKLNEDKTDLANPTAIAWVEGEVAKIDLEACFYSLTLRQWNNETPANFGAALSDIMNYFFRQFEVKEKLTSTQVLQLSIKLLAAQPNLKLKELMYVLNSALQGKYGPTYQRVGIDSILQWLNAYYEESAGWLESLKVNGKQEESRGETPWEVEEKRLKKYEDEQRQKQRIVQRVWGEEKKAQEDTARKEQIEAYKNSLTENEKK